MDIFDHCIQQWGTVCYLATGGKARESTLFVDSLATLQPKPGAGVASVGELAQFYYRMLIVMDTNRPSISVTITADGTDHHAVTAMMPG